MHAGGGWFRPKSRNYKVHGSLQSPNEISVALTKKIVRRLINNNREILINSHPRRMDELKAASKRLKVAHDGLEQHYQDCIAAQDKREIMLFERMTELNERKQKAVAALD